MIYLRLTIIFRCVIIDNAVLNLKRGVDQLGEEQRTPPGADVVSCSEWQQLGDWRAS